MLAGIDAIGGFVTGGGASGSLSATAAPSTITKTQSTSGPSVTVTTGPVTVTASGGVPGYSYSWADISSSGISINSPTSATTQFHEFLPADDTETGTFRCTVTDSAGSKAFADVEVTLTLIGP